MQNPFVFTAFMPLTLSVVLCVVAMFVLRSEAARSMAAGAAGISFVVATVLILGLPRFPPVTATQKAVVLATLAVALGLALTARRAANVTTRTAFLVLWVLGLAWVSQRLLIGERWWQVALVCIAGAIVLFRVERAANDGIAGISQIMLCAIGLSLIALLSSSASIAQSAGALAAACGGVMLVNWPRVRVPTSSSVLLPVALILSLLAAQTVLFTQAQPWAVAVLLLVFASPSLINRVVIHRELPRDVWLPVLLLVAGSIPVAAAVLLTRAAAVHGVSY